jgi:quinol-cytochrome oxidoreductase complex cytochrome b subunit
VLALTKALRGVLLATGVAFLVLLGSGLYLVWNYRPPPSPLFLGFSHIHVDSLPGTMRTVHRDAALAFLLLGVLLAGLAIVDGLQRRRVGAPAAAIAFVVAALAAAFSGSLLPWDQVALWAVTVGVGFKGFTKILSGDNVRYLIVGNTEISPHAFNRWFYSHTVVIPTVLIALAIVVLLATRARPAPDPDSPFMDAGTADSGDGHGGT